MRSKSSKKNTQHNVSSAAPGQPAVYRNDLSVHNRRELRLHRPIRGRHPSGIQFSLGNLQLGIIGRSTWTAENGAAAIFLIAILVVRHAASGAIDLDGP